jgi:hypothetical protein
MSKTSEQLFFESLDEKQKRLFAALKASELGYFGVCRVSQELGIHRHTIRAGQKELVEISNGAEISTRIRKVGGGRKKTLPKNQS